jgi:hypothetical protein
MANQLIIERALDGDGYVLPGAKATVYADGTATLIPVYSDAAGSVSAANPIVADADGFWPQRYVTEPARVVVQTAANVTIYTLDPCPTTSVAGSAASGVSVVPSVDLPHDNVQDALDFLAAGSASGFDVFGLGITGNATLLASIDATSIAAGTYRFDGTTAGTYPTGIAAADTGLIETWRQASGTAMMMLYHATSDRVFHRRLATTWGAWREVITSNQAPAEGDILYRSASAWTRLAKGTAGQVPNSDGTTIAYSDRLASGTVNTTTGGTAVAFTVPTWAKRVIMSLSGASLSGSDNFLVQLSTSAAYVTSGYSNGSGGSTYSSRSGSGVTSAAGFVLIGSGAGIFATGTVELIRHTGNTWIATHLLQNAVGGDDMARGSGLIALAGAIDGIRLTRTGTDTFDAMSANVHWF